MKYRDKYQILLMQVIKNRNQMVPTTMTMIEMAKIDELAFKHDRNDSLDFRLNSMILMTMIVVVVQDFRHGLNEIQPTIELAIQMHPKTKEQMTIISFILTIYLHIQMVIISTIFIKNGMVNIGTQNIIMDIFNGYFQYKKKV